jgi:PPM family protein phosphatase
MLAAMAATLPVRFAARTDVGRKRDHNEDNFLVDPKLSLFVVCDGMGGHAAGEEASRYAIHSLRNCIGEQTALLDRYLKLGNKGTHADKQEILGLLETGINQASAASTYCGTAASARSPRITASKTT